MADARLQRGQEPVSYGHSGSKDDHDIGRNTMLAQIPTRVSAIPVAARYAR